jgi:hypothetical protein
VLSLVKDPRGTLREFFRVLNAGGQLVFSDIYRRREITDQELPDNCCLAGATSRELLFDWLHKAGFKIQLWQDRSNLLAELAARLAWQNGSLTEFWSQFAANGDGRPMQQAVQAMRPGYCLVVAAKQS